MTTAKRRSERQQLNPDLGVLTARLQWALQGELYERLAADGHRDLHPRHSAVLAYLDEDGVRATELARLSGRDKQVVGRIVDELEAAGYIERRPDPSDRRAKLIVPTERGLEQIRLRDEIVAEIERRHAESAGPRVYAEFRNVLRGIVERGSESPLTGG
jgi:DNA-binding MarR family transcriptional regulator